MKKCAFFEKWCIQNVNYGELSTTQVVRALFVLLLIYQRKRRGNSSRDWTGSGRNAGFWKYKKDCKSFDLQSLKSDRRGSNLARSYSTSWATIAFVLCSPRNNIYYTTGVLICQQLFWKKLIFLKFLIVCSNRTVYTNPCLYITIFKKRIILIDFFAMMC